MDNEDYSASDSGNESAKLNLLTVSPLKPFRAKRAMPDREPLDVSVVGLRYIYEDDEWQFICICEDAGEIYVCECEALDGDLPYSKN